MAFSSMLNQGSDFSKPKSALCLLSKGLEFSKGRNLLLNKQDVGRCQSVSEFGQRLFCCATEMGVKKETELIVLADATR